MSKPVLANTVTRKPAAPQLSATLRTATSVRSRPPRPGAIFNIMTFGWRALLKIKHIPEQSFDVMITPIMFTVMTVSWMFLMPVTFASNIYVDPATLPEWLRTFVAVNPVTHLVTAIRSLMDGDATFNHIALALVAPVVLTATGAPVAMILYHRKR